MSTPNKKILVIHGPNLGLLGTREPEIYGNDNLDTINKEMLDICNEKKIDIEIKQFDSEGDIVTCLGKGDYDALIINPAAYTHTSVAIADAIKAVDKPAVEVHLSNIYQREEFRHKSLVAQSVIGQISGFGKESYLLALQYVSGIL